MKAAAVIEANNLLLRRDSLARAIKQVKGEHWQRDKEDAEFIIDMNGSPLPPVLTQKEVLDFLDGTLIKVNTRLVELGVEVPK